MRTRRRRLGIALARLHQGAFVHEAPPVAIALDLEADVVTLALRGSAGALAYRRLVCAPRWPVLRDAFRLHTLQAIDHARRVEDLARRLAEARIDALFFKGWTLSRRYPAPALRPHGDADVLVRLEDHARAQAWLASHGLAYAVDLHVGFTSLPHVTFDALHRRRETIALRDVDVPCLGEDDHLAYLCLHFLRHGGARPMWLVDVAMLIERRSPGEAWWRVLAHDAGRCRAARAVGAVALALVGTRLPEDAPPPWLFGAVLDAWGRGVHRHSRALAFDGVANVVRDLRERWPTRIEAVHAAWPASLDRAPHLGHRVRALEEMTTRYLRLKRSPPATDPSPELARRVHVDDDHLSTPVEMPIPMVRPT